MGRYNGAGSSRAGSCTATATAIFALQINRQSEMKVISLISSSKANFLEKCQSCCLGKLSSVLNFINPLSFQIFAICYLLSHLPERFSFSEYFSKALLQLLGLFCTKTQLHIVTRLLQKSGIHLHCPCPCYRAEVSFPRRALWY